MENITLNKPVSFAHIDVDTYVSAKESLDYLLLNSIKGALIVLDDYGGWFTDGVTKLGNEIKSNEDLVVIPNHLGQLIIYKYDQPCVMRLSLLNYKLFFLSRQINHCSNYYENCYKL